MADAATAVAALEEQAASSAASIAGSGSGSGSGSGGGGGSAAPMYSSAEQMLMDRLGELESDREEAKWMAMANFGLALMSSKRGSLGGAVGEAGQAAMAGYQTSLGDLKDNEDALLDAQLQLAMARDDHEQARKIAMIRSSSSGSSGTSTASGMTAGQIRELGVILSPYEMALKDAERVLEDNTLIPGEPDHTAALQALRQREAELAAAKIAYWNSIKGSGQGMPVALDAALDDE